MKKPQEKITQSCFDTLAAAEMAELEKTEIYRRFLAAREKLDGLAAAAWAQTGRLNSPAVLKQEKTVSRLGAAMLEEIEAIQFRLREPSYAAFCKAQKAREK